jgi:hypothetical protein
VACLARAARLHASGPVDWAGRGCEGLSRRWCAECKLATSASSRRHPILGSGRSLSPSERQTRRVGDRREPARDEAFWGDEPRTPVMGYETSQRVEQLGRHRDRLRITLAGRPLGEALLRHAQVGGVHPGLWPPDAVPVRDHPRRATAAASTCSSVRSGFASGFMQALSVVAVAASTPSAVLTVQRLQRSPHRHGRPLPAGLSRPWIAGTGALTYVAG